MFMFNGGKDAARRLQFNCAVHISARLALSRTSILHIVIGNLAHPCHRRTGIVLVQPSTARLAVEQGARHA
jgi:hypothetical protein